MSKWTPEQIAQLKQIREDNPEFAKEIDALRLQFPGSKIVYMKSGDLEFGERGPEGVVPFIDHAALAREKAGAKPQEKRKPMTVADKRRAVMKYKE